MIDLKPKTATPGEDPVENIKYLFDIFRQALNGDEYAKSAALIFIDLFEKALERNDGQSPYDINLFEELLRLDDDFDNEMGEWFEVPYPLDLEIAQPSSHTVELLLRIKLLGTKRQIWREVVVPSNLNLEATTRMLLLVMGWNLQHKYNLRHKRKTYLSTKEIENDLSVYCGNDMSELTLSDILNEKGERMKIEYDYTCDWKHEVLVKDIREYEKGEKPKIAFVKGHGACPPEDCNGMDSYEHLLALRAKEKPTRNERKLLEDFSMLPSDKFDPALIDLERAQDSAILLDDLYQERMKKKRKRKK